MARPTNWREAAEYVTADMPNADWRILGEDSHGDLLVPSRTRADHWDRRFNPRNPAHWPYYLRSRLTNRLAFLDTIEATR